MKELLIQLSKFLAVFIGPSAEIILHDITEQTVCVFGNPSVTGRHFSEKDDPDTVHILREKSADCPDNFIINYDSDDSASLRSAQCFFRDDNGNLRFALCINQNVFPLQQMQDFISYFLNREPSHNSITSAREDTIDSLTTDLIFEELRRMKYASIDTNTREARLAIIRSLDEKGIFDVKNATTKVCCLLDISQATLYNYLKEIRG